MAQVNAEFSLVPTARVVEALAARESWAACQASVSCTLLPLMYVHPKRPVPRPWKARTHPAGGSELTCDEDVQERMTHQRHTAVILGAGNQDPRGLRGTFPRGLERLDTGRPAAEPGGTREPGPDAGTESQGRLDVARQRRLAKLLIDQRHHGRGDEARGLDRSSQRARDHTARTANELGELGAGALDWLERGVAFSFQPAGEVAARNWGGEVPGGRAVPSQNDLRQAQLGDAGQATPAPRRAGRQPGPLARTGRQAGRSDVQGASTQTEIAVARTERGTRRPTSTAKAHRDNCGRVEPQAE